MRQKSYIEQFEKVWNIKTNHGLFASFCVSIVLEMVARCWCNWNCI